MHPDRDHEAEKSVSYDAAVSWQVWIIVFCFLLLTGFSLVLAFKME